MSSLCSHSPPSPPSGLSSPSPPSLVTIKSASENNTINQLEALS